MAAANGCAPVSAEAATSSGTPASAAEEVRCCMRFYTFNMGKSSKFPSVGELLGPGGRGRFSAVLDAPLADGSPIDLAFCTFVETRLQLSDWVAAEKEERALSGRRLGELLIQKSSDQTSEGTRKSPKDAAKAFGTSLLTTANQPGGMFASLSSSVRSPDLMSVGRNLHAAAGLAVGFAGSAADLAGSTLKNTAESAAGLINGHLKNLLAFSKDKFVSKDGPGEAHKGGVLHGKLVERKVGGINVPNPKKAFVGQTVCLANHPEKLSFCFVGAHFPVEQLSAKLEAPTAAAALASAKLTLGRTLRKVLRKAAKEKCINSSTILIIQGDLNSRTVLSPGEFTEELPELKDVLLEFLRDIPLQEAIQKDLKLPPGRWQEVALAGSAADLPVTYKFQEELGRDFQRAFLRKGDVQGCQSFFLRDLLEAVQSNRGSRKENSEASSTGTDIVNDSELYRRIMGELWGYQLDGWGLHFKESGFRPFRFPASADRVIFWAPAELANRVSVELPQGCYEVNHFQAGSDHRPVTLEAIFKIAPKSGAAGTRSRAVDDSQQLAPGVFHPEDRITSSMLLEIVQSDSDESDDEADVDSPVQIADGRVGACSR